MFAISKLISKAAGIHRHSNNGPWHRKAICNYFRAGKKKQNNNKQKNNKFLVSFCSQTEHVERLFQIKDQKQIDCKCPRVSAGLRGSHLSLSLSLSVSPYHTMLFIKIILYTTHFSISIFYRKLCPMNHTENNVFKSLFPMVE